MRSGKVAEESGDLVLSFLAVRKAVGILGLFLPVSLIASGLWFEGHVQSSISAMYHTAGGDLLEGIAVAIAVFLWSYVGYQKRPQEIISDWLISRLAALGALGVALVPVSPPWGLSAKTPQPIAQDLAGCPQIGPCAATDFPHYMAAGLFFACLAVFCLVLFPRREAGCPEAETDRQKRADNMIYRFCGGVLVGVIIAIGTYGGWYWFVLDTDSARMALDNGAAVFVLETVGIVAFSVSWLVKGKTLTPLRSAARALV